MPIIKSAIKRVRQTKVRTARNASRKRTSKEIFKNFIALVSEKKLTEAAALFPRVQKAIDLLAKNNLWHKNKAARKKASFSKMIAGTPAVKKAAPAKKAAPKKATTTKKTVAKKAPAKKPATKK